MITIENKVTDETFGPFREDQLAEAFESLKADKGPLSIKPNDWHEFLNAIHDIDTLKAKFTELNEISYFALTCDEEVFCVISGEPSWISEEGWEALERKNPSVATYDITTRCEDAEQFKDYGLSCVAEHEQALKLVRMIMEHGF